MKYARYFTHFAGPVLLASLIMITNAACKPEQQTAVQAWVEGRLMIDTEVDSTGDNSEFELLIATQTEGDVDTLGIAVTDRDGRFTMSIEANDAGVFPLIISRADTRLVVAEFVVADGDSTTINGTFPLEGRRLRIVSPENSAWAAYRNAKYQHNQALISLVENQSASLDNMDQVVERTSTILWSLRTSFPGAFAADLAAVESVAMLEGFNDSLVVAHLHQIDPDNRSLVNAVRAARRATARLYGLDSSLALVRRYQDRLSDRAQKAELQAELVVAYSDSSMDDEALAAALELRREYPDSEWADWASRASYEFENLLPGMQAPAFSIVDTDGNRVNSEDLRGKYLILEFFEPRNEVFLKEFGRRKSFFSSLDERAFQTLSISLEPDQDVNEALFEEGKPEGHFAFIPGGRDSDIARLYNIQVIPTRFLIDPDGVIVRKYPGSGMLSLAEDVASIYAQLTGESSETEGGR